ncbi:MAG: M67 family metallopeptidase [Pseudomonadota bacterium]
MTRRVELPPPLAAAIEAAAAAAFPNECCGLLEGTCEGAVFRITALHPARNICDDPERFQIDPADHFKAQKTARGNGRAIIGCYHSHPSGGAQPSAADLAGAQENNFLWLIAGQGELNAFVYLDGDFRGCVTGAD